MHTLVNVLAVVGAVLLAAIIVVAVYAIRSVEGGDWERGGPPEEEKDNDGIN